MSNGGSPVDAGCTVPTNVSCVIALVRARSDITTFPAPWFGGFHERGGADKYHAAHEISKPRNGSAAGAACSGGPTRGRAASNYNRLQLHWGRSCDAEAEQVPTTGDVAAVQNPRSLDRDAHPVPESGC